MNQPTPTGILFVCLGNICRSPLAKVIMLDRARRRGAHGLIHVDSCGTGAWHIGKGADPRSIQIAAVNGLNLEHTARQLEPGCDFDRFDWLIAMDRDNREALLHRGAPADKVRLARSFDPELAGEPDWKMEVPDPYYGGDDGFRIVFDMLVRACDGMLDQLTGAGRTS